MIEFLNFFELLFFGRRLATSGLLFIIADLSKRKKLIWLSFILAPVNSIKFFLKRKKTTSVSYLDLHDCLKSLGPIFIKFGQTISTRPDIIGEELAFRLKLLQDRLEPFPFQEVEAIITAEFGIMPEQLFLEFSKEPVAAASIAQVHKAKLKTGQNVAVKILRPNIAERYQKDIKLLYFLGRLVAKLLPQTQRLRPYETVKIFEDTMHQELNLMREAAACSELKSNFKNEYNVVIPEIYWDYCSEGVLTTQWINGISIYDTAGIDKFKLDRREIAKKLGVIFFNQAYRDGYFHADLHPGNILVQPDGKLALLDFGIMGRLHERDRLAIAEILYAFLNGDYKRVAEIHLKVHYVPSGTDIMAFAQACRAVAEPTLAKKGGHFSVAKLLGRLLKITEEFGMKAQPQLILLQKTMVVVEGIGQLLDPEVNMWLLAEPWIRKWAAKNITPEAKILRIAKKLLHKLEQELELN